ncbi:uncharacterized protein LOC109816612 isoform X2 [Cajanus cajan]|uniref:uncharacterized protein LOC109816612 isoform X2 n=1 Tax=Cajanus cajan TaxID=3821 RepID=UPI0010FB501A|nr:uncharacterized protein LOC109816612 isoform X2 [Cajanus cajan]
MSEKEKKDEKEYFKFDDEIVKAQKAAAMKKWEQFKAIINNKELLKKPFDMFGNTAIHVVARSGREQQQVLIELLHMLSHTEQLDALRWQNCEGNTVLHEVMLLDDPKMVDVIMEVDKMMEHDKKPLLEIVNNANETPAYRAAKYGMLRVLKHLHANYGIEYKHFPDQLFKGLKRPILHYCLLTFNFGTAIWLLENIGKRLARKKVKKLPNNTGEENRDEEDKDGIACLKVLSKMPMAFESTDTRKMGLTKTLIYKLLPEDGYESESEEDDARNSSVKVTRDEESSQPNDENKTTTKSRYIYIENIWNKKKSHKFAEQLLELLLDSDDSWKQCVLVPPNEPIGFSMRFPSNVTKRKEDIELKDRVEMEERVKESLKESRDKSLNLAKNTLAMWETPLFLGAASGIVEVVKRIVERYPEAISYVNDDGLNVLHVAVKHRQLKIYEYIVKIPAYESLITRISKDKRTILHQAASMDYYREQSVAGVAYQLQRELQWYHRVSEIVPRQYLMHTDKDGLTPGGLLDIDHADMHNEAKQWMKETSQSCSTVAVLIAGVVFAAAYAIPGGTEGGRPVLSNSSAFRIFTIMDVVALATSLGSVVMFLSILTSSFELWEFHKSLPRKLKLGFMMLFFSLITTMLAFAATILLTIRLEGNKKSTTLAYSLAFVIVSIFGLTQFPLYEMLEDQFENCSQIWKSLRKIV